MVVGLIGVFVVILRLLYCIHAISHGDGPMVTGLVIWLISSALIIMLFAYIDYALTHIYGEPDESKEEKSERNKSEEKLTDEELSRMLREHAATHPYKGPHDDSIEEQMMVFAQGVGTIIRKNKR